MDIMTTQTIMKTNLFNGSAINCLIKPTDACNLKCKYCFVEGGNTSYHFLSLNHLEKFISLLSQHYETIQIVWHGGEPLLAGESFFIEAFKIIDDYQKRFGFTLTQAIQTNAVCLNDSFIDLFRKNHIGIGLSFDGIYNDSTRGKTDAVNKAISLLHQKNSYPGAICVLTKQSVDDLINVYEDFKVRQQGVTFRPVVIDGFAKNQELFNLAPDYYIQKMCQLFDYWLVDSNCHIRVNPFIQLINMYLGISHSTCNYNSCIGRWFCLEPNGDITPCNRSLGSEYIFGNIADISDFEQVLQSAGMNKLLKGAIARRKVCQTSCEYYNYCNGGCNHSAIVSGNLETPGGFECRVFKGIFFHIISSLNNPNIKPTNPTLLKIVNSISSAQET